MKMRLVTAFGRNPGLEGCPVLVEDDQGWRQFGLNVANRPLGDVQQVPHALVDNSAMGRHCSPYTILATVGLYISECFAVPDIWFSGQVT